MILVRRFFPGLRLVLVAMSCLALFSSCGGATSSSPDLDESSSLGPIANIIMSDAYAGYLVMHLDESLGAQLDSGKSLYSTKAQSETLISIQSAIDSFSDVELRRSVDIDPDKLNALRARLERKSGKTLADFNSIYKVEAPDPNEALTLYNALKTQAGVRNIYPGQKLALMSITSVPDLAGLQGYLYPESTHGGLNAQAAWNEGVLGQNVRLVDFEMAWNHEHEDLSVPANTYQCSIPSADPACQKKIAHGTSVAGIIGSLHNSHGTDGFAPEATLELEDIHIGTIEGTIIDLLENGLAPGSIIFIEVAAAGLNANDLNCITDTYGCIPTSIFPYNFNGIEYAIAAGVTVIEGAGNGYVDLGDPSHYGSSYVNISTHDSGSIIVGASWGANKQIRADSNYGSRVNVFAWGDRVVTTGYPYSGSPYIWDGSVTPAPSNNETNTYYTNMFGGTSAATAMIAGAAALVQSYAKQELGQPATRFLTPAKVREILVNSGVSQVGGGGNIGKQPRIDIAMNLVDTLVNNAYTQFPALETGDELTENELNALQAMGIGLICAEADPETHALVGANDPSCPDAVLWPEGNYISKPYDFDGDGRADLVKFNNAPSTGSGQGWWYVDLSSKGTAADGFGAWDIAVQFTPLPGQTVWPYVADMNSDGRCDFVAYDKLNGTFYVALTDSALIEHNTWHGWDWEIDYSSEWRDEYAVNPEEASYSRPVLGNFNMTGSANS
ncbi:MAG: S8 family serine peptidase, partial [Thermodesulfobacteriota bacterium]